MNVYKVKAVFILVLCALSDVYGEQRNVGQAEPSFSGIAYEIVLTKLDYLQDTIVEFQSARKQADLKLSDEMSKQESTKLIKMVNQLNQYLIAQQNQSKKERDFFEQKLTHAFSATNEQHQNHLVSVKKQGESIEHKFKDVVNQMSFDLSALHEQSQQIKHTLDTQHDQMVTMMQMLASKKDQFSSGKYKMQPTNRDVPFLVNCDQTIVGGGWLVFQYRYNGEVDFFRNWTEYRDGFGDVDGEFWLGLERLHQLTSARPHELLIELKDYDGSCSYARYEMFQIGSETEQYPIKVLRSYAGTAGDSLKEHKGMKFTTKDRDNDKWSDGNSASYYEGAWWYGYWPHSSLNGPYTYGSGTHTMFWGGYRSRAYSRMMIREK